MTALADMQTRALAIPTDDYCEGVLLADRYRLGRVLGKGGMGTVWEARNVLLDLPVAVKMIRPEVRCEEASLRLLAEARMGARVDHPGVVRVLDYGLTRRGDAYLVMEYLCGQSLADLMREQSRLGAALAVQLMLPVIDALRAVHARGIVHRDLKPDNIFLALSAGALQPKLLDFGIATCSDSRVRGVITQGGTVLGSPAYMAPEQARGQKDIDARVDIWSACVVLYELVSGKPAFRGDSCASLISAVAEVSIPPLSDTGGGEAALFCILRRGLSKARQQRYATIAELGDALASWLACRGFKQDIGGVALRPRFRLQSTTHCPRAEQARPLLWSRVRSAVGWTAASSCLMSAGDLWKRR